MEMETPNQSYLSEVFQKVPVGIITTDLQGKALAVNPAFIKIIDENKKPSDLVGISVFELFQVQDNPGLESKLRDAFQQSTSMLQEKVEFAKRKTCYLNIYVSKIETGLLFVLEDVTETTQVKDQLEERIKEFEKFIKVAVGRELRIAQLKKENQMLKKRLGELGEETPLEATGIKGLEDIERVTKLLTETLEEEEK